MNWDVFVWFVWSELKYYLSSPQIWPDLPTPALYFVQTDLPTSHDWCGQKPLCTCQSCIDFRLPPTLHTDCSDYQGGSPAWKPHHKLLISWSRSSISQHYYIVLDSRHATNSISVVKGWLSSWLVSWLIVSRYVSLSSCEYSRVWIFCQYFDTFRQFDGVYWVYTVFPSHPIIDCKLNGRNERRSEPFFPSVTKYLTNPMQRLLRRLYISYYGLLRNFSLV